MMKLPRTALSIVLPLLSFALGCAAASHGGNGQPCICTDCSLLSGTFTCNSGLVCNESGSQYTCEPPNSVDAGGACGADDNCATGLYCAASVCASQIGDGGACNGDPNQCAEGLTCTKVCGSSACAPAGATSVCPDGGS